MYKSKKEYLTDCIIATIGSMSDENYKILPFEDVLPNKEYWSNICKSFILYSKNIKDTKYLTKINFIEKFLNNSSRKVLTDDENNFIDLIYEQKNNLENNLKDPEELFKNLENTKKKIQLKESLQFITNTDSYKDSDPITWTDDYCKELLENTENLINQYEVDSKSGNLLYAENIEDYYNNKIEERSKGKTYSFHWKPLDDLIPEGPTPGHGGTISGSTGMGKSALALNLADHLIDADIPVLMLPIEMGEENTIDRLISLRTKIPYSDLLKMKPDEYESVKNLINNELTRLKVHNRFAICTDADISLRKLETIIKKFQSSLLEDKYCVVIIDLLTMIKEFYATEGNLAQTIEKAINHLDILSKKLGFHYIGIVQLNRTVEQDKVLSVQSIEKLKPTRSSIKNSNALLERARWNLSIFRPKYFADLYLSEEESEVIQDVAEISLMKANNSNVGKVYMDYDGTTFSLTEREDL